jgi:excisionase family DNA binding protein
VAEQFSPSDREWLTVLEAARESPYTPRTIRQYIARNTLPAMRRGNQWFIKAEDLKDYIARMEQAGTQKHAPKRGRND